MDFMDKVKREKEHIFRHKTKRRITVLLAVATATVWLISMFAKYLLSIYYGYDFKILDVVDSVLDNIIGILPPLIIFNFVYEDLVQDLQADELSEQITKTLMGSQDSMGLFDNETKTNFLHTTMVSLLKEEKGDMVFGMAKPYLDSKYNIRKQYQYLIKLKPCTEQSDIFLPDKYILIQEKFTYIKCFANIESKIGKEFKIAYFLNEEELDNQLKGQNYIFREDLNIHEEDLEKLSQLSDEEKEEFIHNFMKLNVRIEEELAKITKVVIDENGIFIDFSLEEEIYKNEMLIEIFFLMPQVKQKSKFLAAISEPTYGPNIQFIYDEDMADIIMFPFLNMSVEARKTTHFPGVYQISAQDEWVMPMSGVVFIIDIK